MYVSRYPSDPHQVQFVHALCVGVIWPLCSGLSVVAAVERITVTLYPASSQALRHSLRALSPHPQACPLLLWKKFVNHLRRMSIFTDQAAEPALLLIGKPSKKCCAAKRYHKGGVYKSCGHHLPSYLYYTETLCGTFKFYNCASNQLYWSLCACACSDLPCGVCMCVPCVCMYVHVCANVTLLWCLHIPCVQLTKLLPCHFTATLGHSIACTSYRLCGPHRWGMSCYTMTTVTPSLLVVVFV